MKSSKPFGVFVLNAFVWKSFIGTFWVFGASPKPKSKRLLLLFEVGLGWGCYTFFV